MTNPSVCRPGLITLTPMLELVHQERFRLAHRWAPGHMSDYLDGELAPRGRRRMERHVGECPECRHLLASLRRMLETLRVLPAPGVRTDARTHAAAVRARLDEPPTS